MPRKPKRSPGVKWPPAARALLEPYPHPEQNEVKSLPACCRARLLENESRLPTLISELAAYAPIAYMPIIVRVAVCMSPEAQQQMRLDEEAAAGDLAAIADHATKLRKALEKLTSRACLRPDFPPVMARIETPQLSSSAIRRLTAELTAVAEEATSIELVRNFALPREANWRNFVRLLIYKFNRRDAVLSPAALAELCNVLFDLEIDAKDVREALKRSVATPPPTFWDDVIHIRLFAVKRNSKKN